MRQVGELILAEPRRFNMLAVWIERINPDNTLSASLRHAKNAIPPCGTVACFAGEWAIENGYESVLSGISSLCARSLDLPNDHLFFVRSWPARLQTNLKAGTPRYAEHFVKVVLEDYIATNGWENEL